MTATFLGQQGQSLINLLVDQNCEIQVAWNLRIEAFFWTKKDRDLISPRQVREGLIHSLTCSNHLRSFTALQKYA